MNNTQKNIKKKFSYPDDRTKNVKIIDTISRIIAVILGCLLLINANSLLKGGGYDDTKIVPLFGLADSRIAESYMKPEIPDESVVFIKVALSYSVGDVVQYCDKDQKTNPVSQIIEVNGSNYVLKGTSQDTEVVATEDMMVGKVIGHNTFLYNFFGWYHTALGAVSTAFLSFLFLCLGDILMIKKRKAALMEKREEQKKKEERKKRAEAYQAQKAAEQGLRKTNAQLKAEGFDVAVLPESVEEEAELVDTALLKEEKRQEKIEKEKKEIEDEMKKLQEQMKKEEEEFRKSKEKKGK